MPLSTPKPDAIGQAATLGPRPGLRAACSRWDIFCRVIDNHGDLGVCWRLAQALARRGQAVRLIADDPSALAWMAPADALPVQVQPWDNPAPDLLPADVVVEAFGCDPPTAYVARMAAAAGQGRSPLWINLEYLSAEAYVRRSHGLRSPQSAPHAQGLDKWFFYPGFTPGTGGLLHADQPDAAAIANTRAWLQAQGLAPAQGERAVLVFGYHNPALPVLLNGLAGAGLDGPVEGQGESPVEGPPGHPTLLWLAPGPMQQALLHARWPAGLRAVALPPVPQPRFDALLALSSLNLVRGEDSFVRAQVVSDSPLLWQIYPQHDGAHAAKLQAFAERWLAGAPAAVARSWRRALWALNGLDGAGTPAALHWPDIDSWAGWQPQWRRRLRAQDDLADSLLAFASQARPSAQATKATEASAQPVLASLGKP